MIHPDGPTPQPAPKLVRACERATAQIAPLIDILEPLAKSRPDTLVPADLLALARRALHDIGPVARSLGADAPLPLHPPVTHSGLAARLALADRQARMFRRRHAIPDGRLEAIAWHVEDRTLAVAAGHTGSGDKGKPLHI
jgi:hypothetical protein